MGEKTKIEWADSSWNPVSGCTEVSPGCDHCYAKSTAERFRGTPGHYYENGFDLTLRPDKLDLPLRWVKPRRIFVNSMSDLFHDQVPSEYVARVFAVMALAPRHTFQLLTKRHGRMRSLVGSAAFRDAVATEVERLAALEDSPVAASVRDEVRRRAAKWLDPLPGGRWPLPNVWLGVSVEEQRWADIRIPALLETPAAVRFLSMEPLLGPVMLDRYLTVSSIEDIKLGLPPLIDWVIVGGESGHGARPMHPAWARSLRDQCVRAGVPFTFKQWGEWQDGSAAPWQRGEDHIIVRDGRHEPARDHWAKDERGWWTSDLIKARNHREKGSEDATFISRVGKKAAGRDLDGRTWDQYPDQQTEPTP